MQIRAGHTCEVTDWRSNPLKPLRRQIFAAASLNANWNTSGQGWNASWTAGTFKLAFQLVGQAPTQRGYRLIHGLLLIARLRQRLFAHSVPRSVPTLGNRACLGSVQATWRRRKPVGSHSLSRLPNAASALDDVV